ncbi:DUF302 domain-containing protein [Sulfobacillus harzensis]|uniref:DUF302 domain-containing protein n=1 Tax=Sulfobacillus harzensis TaxID=2729629 RepID=A0A7Y0Q379_9FIRM|nr:DUF302 domain-containing protein [Sulfobacillus harzensis]NMP21919.1 DUF302 domain-containing protein [Sulfobacillus harzensis]
MSELMYQVPTKKSVDEAVQAVGHSLKNHQFGVLWDLDINEKLTEKGLEPEPSFRILEVCSAPRAKKALSTNQTVGYFLPCKVLVYQDRESGETRIGYAKPDALMGLLGDNRLNELAIEVDQLLKQAVDEAAQ